MAREAAGPRIIFLKLPPPGKGRGPGTLSPFTHSRKQGFLLHSRSDLSGLPVILWVTGWPLPGAKSGRGDRETHPTDCLGLSSQLWNSEVPFSGLEHGRAGRLPEQSLNEGRTCTVASGALLCPHTENFMFVLSQEAHVSLVGREKRAGRPKGKLLSSFVPGGWVIMPKKEGKVRLTHRYLRCPLWWPPCL